MTRYLFPSKATEVAARRWVAGEPTVDFEEARRVTPSVALPKPDDYGDEAASAAWTARTRAAETAPPTWTEYPTGTLAVDRDGDLYELRAFKLDDPKLREQETPGRHVSAKYVEWIKAGHLPPPIRVMESEKGTYTVNDGHHRIAALRAAGKKTVKAWVCLTINRVLENAAIPGTVMPEGLSLARARAALAEPAALAGRRS